MSYRSTSSFLRHLRYPAINQTFNQTIKRSIHQFTSRTTKLINQSNPRFVRLGVISIIAMSTIAPVEGETVVRPLNQSIKLFSAPFSRQGMAEIGVRMCAIQTKAGIVLYNPIHFDTATKRELDAMTSNSPVKFIIAPSMVHHVFLDAAAAMYPQAQVIGPAGLAEKHPSIDRSRFTEINQPGGSGVPNFPYEEVEIAYFPDFIHKDICLQHINSHTLFVCDMLFNLPANEQYSQVADKSRVMHKGMVQKFVDNHMNASAFENDWVAKAMQWSITKTTDEFKQQADRIVHVWKPQVIVPQHGDVIDQNATDLITKRFASALEQK